MTEAVLILVLILAVLLCFLPPFIVPGRPVPPVCYCRNAVPVHIVTGEQVSRWCPDCGKTVYTTSWIFRGGKESP